jgi:hypothetical protein
MIGRRLPLGPDGKPAEWPTQPGDYVGPCLGFTGDLPAVFFLKPNARDEGVPPIARAVQHVTSPPHTFRECPDGSLEIRASLGDQHPIWKDGQVVGHQSDGWHGYLDEGHVWRTA